MGTAQAPPLLPGVQAGKEKPLTSWIQESKAETRVKTVGFFRALQPSAETKLAIPWTSHRPFSAWQFRGPPESPWK